MSKVIANSNTLTYQARSPAPWSLAEQNLATSLEHEPVGRIRLVLLSNAAEGQLRPSFADSAAIVAPIALGMRDENPLRLLNGDQLKPSRGLR